MSRSAHSFFQPVNPPRAVQVMAHCGAMGRAPENTATALEQSIADGVEWVDVAVRLSKDGHHALFDDESPDATIDGSGKVRDRTLAELQALDAGADSPGGSRAGGPSRSRRAWSWPAGALTSAST